MYRSGFNYNEMDDYFVEDARRVALNVAEKTKWMMVAIRHNNPKRLAKALAEGADPNARVGGDNIGDFYPEMMGMPALILAFTESIKLRDAYRRLDSQGELDFEEFPDATDLVDLMGKCCISVGKHLEGSGCAARTHDCANILVENARVDLYAKWQPPNGRRATTAMGIAMGKDLWLTAALVRNATSPTVLYGPFGPAMMERLTVAQTAEGEIVRRVLAALENGVNPLQWTQEEESFTEEEESFTEEEASFPKQWLLAAPVPSHNNSALKNANRFKII